VARRIASKGLVGLDPREGDLGGPRRLPYVPRSGHHDLWLTAGGSCGQGGTWGLVIEEGQLADDFTGRRWKTRVLSLDEARTRRLS
jgi:hypothetical protein